MLILSRKKGESIIIGEDIEIVVSDIEGEIIKIGINAPKAISIYRKEVYESIRLNNLEATDSEINISEITKMIKSEKLGDNTRK